MSAHTHSWRQSAPTIFGIPRQTEIPKLKLPSRREVGYTVALCDVNEAQLMFASIHTTSVEYVKKLLCRAFFYWASASLHFHCHWSIQISSNCFFCIFKEGFFHFHMPGFWQIRDADKLLVCHGTQIYISVFGFENRNRGLTFLS